MGKKIIIAVLLCILFLDLSWSFYQYYSTMLDGDMAGGIVPHEEVNKILNDPFGWEVIYHHRPHANPNRFFAHLFFKEYFLIFPKTLQFFVHPIESIYLACAFIKILTHFLIVFIITKCVTQRQKFLNISFLILAILISSVFQTYGYNNDIGIIDISITYTFFYALPFSLLLVYCYLLIFHFNENRKWKSIFKSFILILLTLILPFSGPLIPPIILIGSFLITSYFMLSIFYKKYYLNEISIIHKIPISKLKLALFIVINLFSLYSVYLGTFDTQYEQDQIPIAEKYQRLWLGIDQVFFNKSGFTSLFQFLVFEILILAFALKAQSKFVFKILIGILLFSLIYIFLLPFGGYRPYREHIIRYDTIMPVTIVLLITIGYFGNRILQIHHLKKIKGFYLIIAFIFIYSYQKKDWEIIYDHQKEKEALYQIAASKDEIIKITNDCSIISWGVISDYHASEMNGKLLSKLGITKRAILYYHPIPN